MLRHEKSHEPPTINCPHCELKVNRSDILKLHIQRKHQDVTEPTAKRAKLTSTIALSDDMSNEIATQTDGTPTEPEPQQSEEIETQTENNEVTTEQMGNNGSQQEATHTEPEDLIEDKFDGIEG